MNKKYKLIYLPLFEKDLSEAVDYITINLQNSQAASKLVDKVEKAILKRLSLLLNHLNLIFQIKQEKISIIDICKQFYCFLCCYR